MDRKWQQFRAVVQADPWDFPGRVADRFLAATLVYVPFDRVGESRRPWSLWLSRLMHPLPFVSFLLLALSALRTRLAAVQWIVMGAYLVYLAPYVAVSYYDRYVVALLGIKVLLVLWGIDRLLSFCPWKPAQASPPGNGSSHPCPTTFQLGPGTPADSMT
jgi:hypothetical protein